MINPKSLTLQSGLLILLGNPTVLAAEPAPPFGARLSVAGGKSVVVIGIKSTAKGDLEKPDNMALRRGPMILVAWQRGLDGKWTGPRELTREEQPLAAMSALNELRPGLQVQAYAPPNFVPIAWSCEKQKWVKFMRVPVD